jgi:hypothetical protein
VPWGGRERLFGLEVSWPPVRAQARDEIDVAALEGVVLDVRVDDLADGEGLELRVAEDDGWGGLVGCVEGGRGERKTQGFEDIERDIERY